MSQRLFCTMVPSDERARARRIMGDAGRMLRAHVLEANRLLLRFCEEPPRHMLGRTLAIMARDLTEAADAADTLLQNGAVGPACVHGRTALELLAGILYLTKRNDERIAVARQMLAFDQRLSELEDERAVHEIRYPDSRNCPVTPRMTLLRAARERFRHQNHLHLVVAREIERSASRRDGLVRWYHLFDGPRSLRRMFDEVGLDALYETAYRPWSEAIHGRSFTDPEPLLQEDLRAALAPLRDADEDELARVMTTLSVVLWIMLCAIGPYANEPEGVTRANLTKRLGNLRGRFAESLHFWLGSVEAQLSTQEKRLALPLKIS